MFHSKFILFPVLATSLLVGCAQQQPDSYSSRGFTQGGGLSKADIGTAAGAIGGGVIGYQFGGGAGKALATVGGTLLGGMLGREVGSSLDRADYSAHEIASQRALESGYQESWRGPYSGNYGTINPYRHYTNVQGQPCREYNQTIYIDGRAHSGHGTACRLPDGTWQLMS